jgi:cystathionine beta-lyase
MDFEVAEPITEALRRRADHAVYGYGWPSEALIRAVIDRLERRFGWRVEPDWLVFTPGVIPAITAALRAYTHPGDTVLMADPVYHPFWAVVPDAGCRVTASPLKFDGARYEMDFDDMARRFQPGRGFHAPPQPKAMILCNPHNPVGREWSREELIRAGRIAIDNGAVVISDEIHCELLMEESAVHVPFAAISDEFAASSLVCLSATKTFNLAGLAASVIVIPNARLRADFQRARAGIMPQPDVMAMAALEAAFRDGDEWLAQLLDYLRGNLDFMDGFIRDRIPRLKLVRPEGTYLAWLDCRALGLPGRELRRFFIEEARVGLDDGSTFGPGGAGFQRLNFACTRATLTEALERIARAVNRLAGT